MKHIIDVNELGIKYADENGNLHFIDFHGCYENWSAKLSEDTKANEQTKFKDWKRVGARDLFAEVPYIDFFTIPPTRFEFSTSETFQDLRSRVEKSAWRTIDLG